MNGNYRADLHGQEGSRPFPSDYGREGAYRTNRQYRQLRPSAYPSITDELKSDLAILKSSLDIKNDYIGNLKKSRDSLISKLDFKEIHIEDMEKRIKRYQQFFYRTREREHEKQHEKQQEKQHEQEHEKEQ